MFSFLADIWDALCSLIILCWDALVFLLKTICLWFVDLFNWLKEETCNICINLIYDSISAVGTSVNPDFSCDRTEFLNALSAINLFFPVDNFIQWTLFLLATWLTVCIIRITIKIIFACFSFGGI